MNKKFSTLVASLLLATTVGTASAQDFGFTKSAIPSADLVETVADGRCYQLVNGTNVLVMQKVSTQKGPRFVLKYVPSHQANLGESLWYIKVIKDNKENGVAFKFMNMAYNYPISFDPAKAQVYAGDKEYDQSYLSGEAVAWAWMRNESGVGLNVAKTPEFYFTKDSVMTLVPNANGSVAAVKYDVRKNDKLSALNLRPAMAGPVWLNKNDLNSMLQTQELADGKASFTFEKDVTEGLANLWSAAKGHAYEAVDAVGENTLSYGAVAEAKADYELALAEVEKAKKELDAATENLNAFNGLYVDLSNELKAVKSDRLVSQNEAAKVYKQVQLTNEEGKKISKAIDALESEILAESNATEELKNKVALAKGEYVKALQEKANAEEALLKAENEFVNAQVAYTSAETAHATAVNQQTLYNKWSKALVSHLKTDNNWLSDMTYTDQGKEDAWKGYYEAANVKEAEKPAFQQFIDEFYNAVLAANPGMDPDAAAKTLTGQISKGNKALAAAQKKAVTAANEAALKARGAVDTWQNAYANAQTAKAESEVAANEAKAKYEDLNSQIDTSKLTVLNAALKAQKAKLAALLKEAEKLVADYQDLLKQVATLNKEVAELEAKLVLVEKEASGAFVAYQKANQYYNTAAEVSVYLYSLYLNIDAQKSHNWLSLKAGKNAKGQDTYLMVDTAYLNGTAGVEVAGVQHLGFATREHDVDFVSSHKLAARDINGRFNFRFMYWPTQDSLRIEADGYNQKNVTTTYWKDRTNSEITEFASSINGYENNLVKIAVLGGARREATVGSSENYKGTDRYTINDRIGLNLSPAAHDAVLEAGIYFLDVVHGANAQKNGARLMGDLDGWSLTKVAPAEWDVMNFEHMPAAKWVVNHNTNEFGGYPEIWNQETGNILNNGGYKVLENGDIVINYYYNNESAILANDTLKLTKTVSNNLGFFNGEAKNVNYTLNYLNVTPGMSVSVGDKAVGEDLILRVSADEATKFELEYVGKTWNTPIFEKDTIFQSYYKIRVNDPNKFANNHKYVQVSDVEGTEMLVVTEKEENASIFSFKEVNCVDGTHYYALLTAGNNGGFLKKAGVMDASGMIKAENLATESTTSAFALVADETPLYREFSAEELGKDGAMKFYRVNSTAKAYLYEGENSLLCVEGKGDEKAEAFNVIPTGVEETLMPQYLIAKDVKFIAGDTVLCDATTHAHATKEEALACPHSKFTADTTFGRFLVNMIDSAKADVKMYKWEGKYTRLAFMPGYIADGTLTLTDTDHSVALKLNAHDMAKFSFRLVNEESDDFLIESESHGVKDGKYNEFVGGIAPSANNGGWVKVQNGVPVIINDFEAAMQSDLYNVDTNAGGATSNEEVAVSEVSVVAVDGAIIVKGAAGKTVAISNILGQTIANTVIASDNETIAVPAGIVVVVVEGEEAVKAIVK